MQNLTLKFVIHLFMNSKSAINKKANIENMRKAIDQFHGQCVLQILMLTRKCIILNYIPHETITCDDRDPTWINKDIKELIDEKNQAY